MFWKNGASLEFPLSQRVGFEQLELDEHESRNHHLPVRPRDAEGILRQKLSVPLEDALERLVAPKTCPLRPCDPYQQLQSAPIFQARTTTPGTKRPTRYALPDSKRTRSYGLSRPVFTLGGLTPFRTPFEGGA